MNVLAGKANREVCDVQILDYNTGEPFMKYDFANTTSLNFNSDSVYAMAKGSRKIAFTNPLEGEFAITAQVVPYKMYSLYSDGKIDTVGECYTKKTITATEAGKLNITDAKGTIVEGTVFAYKSGEFGETKIEGTYTEGVFTATTEGDIAAESTYDVGYMAKRESGVQKITLNNKRTPKAVKIILNTHDKDEYDNIIPLQITIMKATIRRNLELAFNSEGDPQEITMTFDLLEKDADNFVEIIALEDDETEAEG